MAATAMTRQNPTLRLGPTSSGCSPVSRESMVTALENGVSKRVAWAPSKRAAAHRAGAGPPSSGKAALSSSTIGITWIPATKPTPMMSASAGATRAVGKAESNAPNGARAPRAFKESTRMPAAPKRANSECEDVSEPRDKEHDRHDRNRDGSRELKLGKRQVDQGDGPNE